TRDERVRVQSQPALEHLDEPPPRACGLAGLVDLARADRRGVDCAHCRLPASSKIGMYMSTTIAPITRPITAIRIGSNSRGEPSIQPPISLPLNSAVRPLLS